MPYLIGVPRICAPFTARQVDEREGACNRNQNSKLRGSQGLC
jgi:hypothetical protein